MNNNIELKDRQNNTLTKDLFIDDTGTPSEYNTYNAKIIDEKLKDVYSTNEIKTNKFWINGKPIYRKVFLLDGLNNTSKVYIDVVTGIEGKNVISITGGGKASDGVFTVFGYNSSATSGFFSIQFNAANQFYVTTSYNFSNIIAIVEYTK